jgi:spore coat polysaccharide biosynthesis protein SpsF (cytidylyltransferase family)
VVPIIHDVNLSHHIWTVDEPEDIEFMQNIFNALYRKGEVFKLQEVLSFLQTGQA